MANSVFANGREIACKAAAGKTICAFPDVCFTPPENPATPPGVPVPYPNTGMASDTTDGSKKVKISDKEVMLKNKSCFKKSMGDEAGAAAKKGVITSKNTGKVYFNAWSMDVKIEGQNVDRHLDLTTNNHASMPGDTPTWPYLDKLILLPGDPCFKDALKMANACEDYIGTGKDPCEDAGLMEVPGRKYDTTIAMPSGDAKDRQEALDMSARASANDCIAAKRCMLEPYKTKSCCPGQTPHHLVEASSFFNVGRGKGVPIKVDGVKVGTKPSVALDGIDVTSENGYTEENAPCVCAEGATQNVGTHGIMHTLQSTKNGKASEGTLKFAGSIPEEKCKTQTYNQAKENAFEAMDKAFPNSHCDQDCIEKQLDNYHNQAGITDKTDIKAVETGNTGDASNEFATENSMSRQKLNE